MSYTKSSGAVVVCNLYHDFGVQILASSDRHKSARISIASGRRYALVAAAWAPGVQGATTEMGPETDAAGNIGKNTHFKGGKDWLNQQAGTGQKIVERKKLNIDAIHFLLSVVLISKYEKFGIK